MIIFTFFMTFLSLGVLDFLQINQEKRIFTEFFNLKIHYIRIRSYQDLSIAVPKLQKHFSSIKPWADKEAPYSDSVTGYPIFDIQIELDKFDMPNDIRTIINQTLIESGLKEESFTIIGSFEQLKTIMRILDIIKKASLGTSILIVIVVCWGLVILLQSMLQERLKDIGILKANGMGSFSIWALFAVQSISISLIGNILSILALTTLSRVNTKIAIFAINTSPQYFGKSLVIGIGIGIVASIPPAIKAIQTPTLDCLKE